MELLVVLAIIGILVSILLPSLTKAKEMSRTAVCMSSIKQVGTGINLFLPENDNFMPDSYSSGEKSWVEKIDNLMNNEYLENDDFRSRNTTTSSIWYCPTFVPDMDMYVLGWSHYVHKAYNSVLGGGFYHSTIPSRQGVHAASIENPSATMLISDAKNFVHDNRGSNLHAANAGTFSYKHKFNFSTIIMFVDGHTEVLNRSKVLGRHTDLFNGTFDWL